MKIALAVIAILLLGTCSQPPSVLEQIMRAGELRVVTRNLPSTYYLGASGPLGPEYELAQQMAAELGVRLYIYSVPNVGDVIRELALKRAHIGAAGNLRCPYQAMVMNTFEPTRRTIGMIVWKDMGHRKRESRTPLIAGRPPVRKPVPR